MKTLLKRALLVAERVGLGKGLVVTAIEVLPCGTKIVELVTEAGAKVHVDVFKRRDGAWVHGEIGNLPGSIASGLFLRVPGERHFRSILWNGDLKDVSGVSLTGKLQWKKQ